jgi:hypothetical protein
MRYSLLRRLLNLSLRLADSAKWIGHGADCRKSVGSCEHFLVLPEDRTARLIGCPHAIPEQKAAKEEIRREASREKGRGRGCEENSR